MLLLTSEAPSSEGLVAWLLLSPRSGGRLRGAGAEWAPGGGLGPGGEFGANLESLTIA